MQTCTWVCRFRRWKKNVFSLHLRSHLSVQWWQHVFLVVLLSIASLFMGDKAKKCKSKSIYCHDSWEHNNTHLQKTLDGMIKNKSFFSFLLYFLLSFIKVNILRLLCVAFGGENPTQLAIKRKLHSSRRISLTLFYLAVYYYFCPRGGGG